MLSAVIALAAARVGQPLHSSARRAIDELAADDATALTVVEQVQRAWRAAGLAGSPVPLSSVRPQDCPFLIKHRKLGLLLVTDGTPEAGWTALDASEKQHAVHFSSAVHAIRIPWPEGSPSRLVDTAGLVFREIGKHRGIFLESLMATALVDIIGLATSLFSMQVYDRVIPSKGYDTLYVLSVGVLIAMLFSFMLNCARSYVLDKTTTKIDVALSNWLFARLLGIRMESRPPSVGAMAAQLKGLELLRGVLCSASLFVIADVPFALVFVAVIFAIGGPLGWVPVVLFPLSLLVGISFQRRLNRLSAETQQYTTDRTGLLVETLDGIESVKANGSGWHLSSRWHSSTQGIGERDCRIKFISALSGNISNLFQQLGYVTIVAFGAYLITENQLTTGGLLACSMICSRALSPVSKLPSIMIQLANLRAVKKGLDRILSKPNEMDDQGRTLSPELLENSIRMEQVQFTYLGGERKALIVPNLEIRQGERVGIIGPIGSGKSTLLKLASGLYRPREGRVFIGGIDAAHLDPQRLQRTVAYIPQEVRLLSGTLRENLLQGLSDPGDDAVLEAARTTGLMDLITNHPRGLALPIQEGGRGISGGQRQLIALTRMLLAKPSIILLDEPTASMDAAAEQRVVQLLDALARAGATLLVATHRSAVLPVVERLLVFDHGAFAVDGPKELVLARLANSSPVGNVVKMTPRPLAVRNIKAAG